MNEETGAPSKAELFWAEWKGFILFLSLMIFFRVAIADWNHVPSGSMRPNLIEGDRIWVNKLAYDVKIPYTSVVLKHVSQPKRGDVVVFFAPKSDRTRMVKRLIGLPGDDIEVINNVLSINGEPVVYEPLTLEPTEQTDIDISLGHKHLTELLPGKAHNMMIFSGSPMRRLPSYRGEVPEGHYLMLGDNRDRSQDSRVWGFVPHDNIIGRSSSVVMSLQPAKKFFLPRGDRFFISID